MKYRFQFRRYALPFRLPVRTAHGLWTQRDGVIVRLEDENGRVAFGEAAPVPAFVTETVDEIDAACRQLGAEVEDAAFAAVPAELTCLTSALAAARRQKPAAVHKHLGVAALLPAGKAAIEPLKEKADSGFRVFKWKVGVADLAEEMGVFDDLCSVLPPEAKLRLDANGAWDRRQAERWLERCAERPVEFVEQPTFAQPSKGALSGQQNKDMDLLLGLAADFPTPIGLDESIVGNGDIERWLGAGWPGIFVLKPALLADLPGALARLAKSDVVFSSALETAVGAQMGLQTAFAWQGKDAQGTPPRALGYGVWPLFADARFNGPAASPYLRSEDLNRIDLEAVWSALI